MPRSDEPVASIRPFPPSRDCFAARLGCPTESVTGDGVAGRVATCPNFGRVRHRSAASYSAMSRTGGPCVFRRLYLTTWRPPPHGQRTDSRCHTSGRRNDPHQGLQQGRLSQKAAYADRRRRLQHRLGPRGLPVFRGLIGPMPEGKNIVRYESPEVFETLTKEWSTAKASRRRRTKPAEITIDG